MQLYYIILILLSSLIVTAICAHRIIFVLHMLQLDSYSNIRLIRWLFKIPQSRLFEYYSGFFLVALLVINFVLSILDLNYGYFFLLLAWIFFGGFLFFKKGKRPKAKKDLVYTSRAIRILIASLFLCCTIIGPLFYMIFKFTGPSLFNYYISTTIFLFIVLFTIQFIPFLVIFANLLLFPIQFLINRKYIQQAKRKMSSVSPIVIGITGSYGKTSTKYILHTLLSERYRVSKTPLSYNTLLGVCRVINNDLKPTDEIFIVEMGAYKKGDIKELSDFVKPKIGILTRIGPQHLERFGSIEAIEKTKYELIQALPKSGMAVFNNDDVRCRSLADRTVGLKVVRYGLENSKNDLSLYVTDINHNTNGISFSILNHKGDSVKTNTILHGQHNLSNILGAVSVALEMNLSLEEIAGIIPKIQPVPHRLELIRGAKGTTVIDDTYNSNPIGVSEALNVLNKFNGGKRILVTPGMVELGEKEAELNKNFGINATKFCDYILLVGSRQTQAFVQGLVEKNFPKERYFILKNLEEATSKLQDIIKSGDVILFENDLPDLYRES